jgi:hypothetical protein
MRTRLQICNRTVTIVYTRQQHQKHLEKAMRSGNVLDEQGKLNNFAIEPEIYVDAVARTGFTEYAEKLNGRLAMLGFVAMLALEAVSGHGLVTLLQSL